MSGGGCRTGCLGLVGALGAEGVIDGGMFRGAPNYLPYAWVGGFAEEGELEKDLEAGRGQHTDRRQAEEGGGEEELRMSGGVCVCRTGWLGPWD